MLRTALAMTACLALVSAASADATFKSRNGDLAYTVSVFEPVDCGGQSPGHLWCGPDYANVFRLARARGAERQITSCQGRALDYLAPHDDTVCHAGGPAWSPDGRRIAYERNDTIYVSRPDGSGAVAVASRYHDPAWSPGGQELVLAGADGLVRLRLADKRTLRVTNAQDVGPDWSRSGRIVFARLASNFALYTVRPDGRSLKRLTSPDTTEPRPWGPSWAPDGRRIVYSDYDMYGGDGGGLLTIPAAGGTPRRLPTVKAFGPPAWSPDGRFFAVPQASQGIAIVRTNGEVVRTVGKPKRGEISDVAWQPRR
jgi:Tol biopolymer transport system component